MKKFLRMAVLFIGAGACAVLGDNMDLICDKFGLDKGHEEAKEPENVSAEPEESNEGENKEE